MRVSLRRNIPPLYQEATIYQALAHIQPGELVPEQVYIQDDQNGSIPAWTVQEREPCGDGFIMTVIDPATWQGIGSPAQGYVGLDVIVMPTRTLAGGMYLYYPGCIHCRNQFCDIRQEARKIAERLAGKRQGSFVSKQRDREPTIAALTASSDADYTL